MLIVVLLSFLYSSTFGEDFEKPLYILEHAEYYFNDFVQTYNKLYADDYERQERLNIFTENLIKINERNLIDTAIHAVNHFSDLTTEEFSARHTGFNPSLDSYADCNVVQDADVISVKVPESFDWRQKNAVTPVKLQGFCGSCYAFASVGNIESQYAIHNNGSHLDLSEQQLVSCSETNHQCDGGQMTNCMKDIIEMDGIQLESDYPYVNYPNSDSHPCQFNKNLTKVKLKSCINYNLTNEDILKQVLFENGPIAAAIAAAGPVMTYDGGVLTECPEAKLDHAVLLVGYGIDKVKGPYWTFKNSWGSQWGEQGYFRVAWGKNSCAMMNQKMASGVIA